MTKKNLDRTGLTVLIHAQHVPDELLECVAVWKEGSSRYLVGRLNKASGGQSSGGQYTCYRYERQLEGGRFVIKMSQSVSGRCEGLWSAEEGDKTYTLRKGNPGFVLVATNVALIRRART